MSHFPFYLQNCPVCGRPLEIRVAYLGRRVACRHCSGQFVASDPACRCDPVVEGGSCLLRRADQLLALANQTQ
ncbi:MAG: hypothetical protein JXB62_01390 [Pirellulales bacterium]|nr:hypothetical protein [Pirellulales bacterium]